MERRKFIELLEDALRAEPGSIREQDELTQLEGWDSIGMLSVIAAIDERYHVTLEADKLLQSTTVADLADVTEKSMSAG